MHALTYRTAATALAPAAADLSGLGVAAYLPEGFIEGPFAASRDESWRETSRRDGGRLL